MIIEPQGVDGLHLVDPESYVDDRGTFRRSYCVDVFNRYGLEFDVCQSNVSVNPLRHTLRGFHYQRPPSREKKLVSVLAGEVFHVVIDLRPPSETYLEHRTFRLSAKNGLGLLIPEGLASAFLTMDDNVIVHYHMADFYAPELYAGIRFDDPKFSIAWPAEPLVISERDRGFPDFDSSPNDVFE